ncbi:MAG: amidoligase family protein, partial [Candidatus Omnitrophica bacterium]|nr:amidoligase family protein [Candidatus Omnitrophota bacterium]
ELKTPPLSGPAGIREVRRVLKKVTSLHSGVNDSCGTHVHIDATKWCSDANNVENYRRLMNVPRAYQYFEPVLDRLMTRARRDSGFAHTMVNVSYRPEYLIHSADDVLENTGQRYLKCNMQALRSHRTIEFRQHAGTLNFTKIMSWMILMQLLMRRVISERSPYLLDYERNLDGLYRFLAIDNSSDPLICKMKSVYDARYTRTAGRSAREARA